MQPLKRYEDRRTIFPEGNPQVLLNPCLWQARKVEAFIPLENYLMRLYSEWRGALGVSLSSGFLVIFDRPVSRRFWRNRPSLLYSPYLPNRPPLPIVASPKSLGFETQISQESVG